MFLNLQILKECLECLRKKECTGPYDHEGVSLYWYKGGELQYFTLENIEQAKQYITIYNKGKERDVPLRSDLRRELLKYAKSQKIESGTLFPGKKDPQKMLTEKTIREHIKKICRDV